MARQAQRGARGGRRWLGSMRAWKSARHGTPGESATPEELHRRNVKNGLDADPAQFASAERLTDLRARLVTASAKRGPPWLRALPGRQTRPVRGLYLWGGVGRGKTYLMDLFHHSLPFADKQRLHFHRFMRLVHDDLRRFAGRADPLRIVAGRFARKTRVLCLDELAVADIGDAMILGGLLGNLFERGVTLVATSNTPPQRLYENGLQRRRFLPAIERIERHTDVVHMGGDVDYRLRVLQRDGMYRLLSRAGCEAALRQSFVALSRTSALDGRTLVVNGRALTARHCAEDVVWFDFPALCEGPRHNDDYIELARLYSTVVVFGVPVFNAAKEAQARRFIGLVDELYDRGVKLVVAAEAEPEQLYQGVLLTDEFARTASRLREMRGNAYLGRPHRP